MLAAALPSAPAASVAGSTFRTRSLATLISQPVRTTVIHGEAFKYAWNYYFAVQGKTIIKRNESSCRRMELRVGVKDGVYAKIQVVREGLETRVIIAPNNEITTASFRLKVGKYFRVRAVEAGVTEGDIYVNGSAMCSTRTGKL